MRVRDLKGNPLPVKSPRNKDKLPRNRGAVPQEIPISKPNPGLGTPVRPSKLLRQIQSLMKLSRIKMFIHHKMDEEKITREIQKAKDWNSIFPKVEKTLKEHPNFCVVNAIKYVRGDPTWMSSIDYDDILWLKKFKEALK